MQDVSTPLDTRYSAELTVLQEMGWSWADLQGAPFDLVEEIRVRVAARARWERERAKRDKARAGNAQQAASLRRQRRK